MSLSRFSPAAYAIDAKVFWFPQGQAPLFSEKFFTSLRQTLLDETQRCLPGEVPASLKSDTGYEISPANSDTDEPAKE